MSLIFLWFRVTYRRFLFPRRLEPFLVLIQIFFSLLFRWEDLKCMNQDKFLYITVEYAWWLCDLALFIHYVLVENFTISLVNYVICCFSLLRILFCFESCTLAILVKKMYIFHLHFHFWIIIQINILQQLVSLHGRVCLCAISDWPNSLDLEHE